MIKIGLDYNTYDCYTKIINNSSIGKKTTNNSNNNKKQSIVEVKAISSKIMKTSHVYILRFPEFLNDIRYTARRDKSIATRKLLELFDKVLI